MGKDVIRLSIEKGNWRNFTLIPGSFSPCFFNTFFIIAGKILPHAEIKSFFSPFPLGRFPNFSAQAREKR